MVLQGLGMNIRVVLPDPVSPRRTVTSFSRITSMSASLPSERLLSVSEYIIVVWKYLVRLEAAVSAPAGSIVFLPLRIL